MNDKIVIEVIVPQLENNYDVFIPINLKIYDIINLIIKSINEITNNEFPLDLTKRLYDKNIGNEIDSNLIVKDSFLRNGSKVILI